MSRSSLKYSHPMTECAALIVAAGRGERFGADRPKQYLTLAGAPILRRSVLAFLNHPQISLVQVVYQPQNDDLYRQAVADLALPEPVTGGASRQDSCRFGLEALAGRLPQDRPSKVLIHDAARPLVDADTISRVIAALNDHPGAIAGVPVVDTLKRSADGVSRGTLDRTGLWRAQTPQGFHLEAILAAHRAAAGAQLTDDAAVAERAGLTVSLVLGNPDNIKVTTTPDLDRAARILAGRGDEAATAEAARLDDIRTGTGFDVHRFGPGDRVILCGVPVPHDQRLEGHSDADVGLHALTDAILGALCAGDIGSHFPPSDPQWAGADSAVFLRHAVDLVTDAGGRIAHADVTLICERPKIGPHREEMRQRLAGLLTISVDRVSVKATTTEQLGFTGRREGIAAQAAVTIRLPTR